MPDFKDDVRERVARLNLEPTREAAIIEEMAQHLEQRYEELIAQGVKASAAHEAALKDLNQNKLEKDLLQVEKQTPFEPALPAGPGLRGTLGRSGKRFSLCVACVTPESGIFNNCNSLAGARDWRKHVHLSTA